MSHPISLQEVVGERQCFAGDLAALSEIAKILDRMEAGLGRRAHPLSSWAGFVSLRFTVECATREIREIDKEYGGVEDDLRNGKIPNSDRHLRLVKGD